MEKGSGRVQLVLLLSITPQAPWETACRGLRWRTQKRTAGNSGKSSSHLKIPWARASEVWFFFMRLSTRRTARESFSKTSSRKRGLLWESRWILHSHLTSATLSTLHRTWGQSQYSSHTHHHMSILLPISSFHWVPETLHLLSTKLSTISMDLNFQVGTQNNSTYLKRLSYKDEMSF